MPPFSGCAVPHSALKWRFWGYAAQRFGHRSRCLAQKRVPRTTTAVTNARKCDPRRQVTQRRGFFAGRIASRKSGFNQGKRRQRKRAKTRALTRRLKRGEILNTWNQIWPPTPSKRGGGLPDGYDRHFAVKKARLWAGGLGAVGGALREHSRGGFRGHWEGGLGEVAWGKRRIASKKRRIYHKHTRVPFWAVCSATPP